MFPVTLKTYSLSKAWSRHAVINLVRVSVYCSWYCLQIILVNHGPFMCRKVTILIKNICQVNCCFLHLHQKGFPKTAIIPQRISKTSSWPFKIIIFSILLLDTREETSLSSSGLLAQPVFSVKFSLPQRHLQESHSSRSFLNCINYIEIHHDINP